MIMSIGFCFLMIRWHRQKEQFSFRDSLCRLNSARTIIVEDITLICWEFNLQYIFWNHHASSSRNKRRRSAVHSGYFWRTCCFSTWNHRGWSVCSNTRTFWSQSVLQITCNSDFWSSIISLAINSFFRIFEKRRLLDWEKMGLACYAVHFYIAFLWLRISMLLYTVIRVFAEGLSQQCHGDR